MLNSNMQHIVVYDYSENEKTEFEKLLNKYLDDNKQSEGKRTRYFLGWDFRVSSNNRILDVKNTDDDN
jgi:hypothetical protein